jgi:hypothetical protein
MGATDTTNGLGNLIVGYNEPREGEENIRTGSHHVVVGKQHQFSSVGGLVVGLQNEIRGAFASVSGGVHNTAAGEHASIGGDWTCAKRRTRAGRRGHWGRRSQAAFAPHNDPCATVDEGAGPRWANA